MHDAQADRFEEVADQYAAELRAGKSPRIQDYVERFPELGDRIERLFPVLELMEQQGNAPENHSEESLLDAEMKQLGQTPPRSRLGDYRILREIGRGGMGIVYEAEQESLGRHVALKILPASSHFDQRRRERFQQEARAAAMLHHTNIVPVFGVGQEDELSYFVMQYIEGEPLDHVLAEISRQRNTGSLGKRGATPTHRSDAGSTIASQLQNGPLPELSSAAGETERREETPAESSSSAGSPQSSTVPESAASSNALSSSGSAVSPEYWKNIARIGIQVADALAYAHTKGILHRDIKPGNLLIDQQGTVWVTDFGLAKQFDSPDLTRTGEIVGTLRYMSPEQMNGKSDERSDLFALGLTLYEMIALTPAYNADDRHQLLQQVLEGHPPSLRSVARQVPRDLETIVGKCLAADPSRRYARAGQVVDDLQRFVEGQPIQARRTAWWERSWKWCRRRPALAAAMAALLISLVGGIAGVTWQWQKTAAALDVAESALTKADEEAARATKQSELTLKTLSNVITNYQDVFDAYNYVDAVSEKTLTAKRRMLEAAMRSMAEVSETLKNHSDYSSSLLIAHLDLADLYIQLGGADFSDGRQLALQELEQALSVGKSWIAAEPDDPYARRLTAQVKEKLAQHALISDQPETAVKWLQGSIADGEELLANNPDSKALNQNLFHQYFLMGTIEFRRFHVPDAVHWYQKSQETGLAAAARGVEVFDDYEQDVMLPELDNRLEVLGRLPAAREDVETVFSAPKPLIPRILYDLAAWYAVDGDHVSAAATLARMDDLEGLDDNQCYNNACGYGRCVKAIQKAGELDDEQLALVDEYAAAALRWLERAAELDRYLDPGNIGLLGRDPDLDGIRDREDFQAYFEKVKELGSQ